MYEAADETQGCQEMLRQCIFNNTCSIDRYSSIKVTIEGVILVGLFYYVLYEKMSFCVNNMKFSINIINYIYCGVSFVYDKSTNNYILI